MPTVGLVDAHSLKSISLATSGWTMQEHIGAQVVLYEQDGDARARARAHSYDHEDIWNKLFEAKGNGVRAHFPRFCGLVELICNRFFIVLGLCCAMWVMCVEFVEAIQFRSAYKIGWVTGAGNIGLALAIGTLPYIIRGAWWRRGELITNDPHKKTYYGVLDVLLKAIEGVQDSSTCVVVLDEQQRCSLLDSVKKKFRSATAIIVLGMLWGAGFGAYSIATDMFLLARERSHHAKTHVHRRLFGLSAAITSFVSSTSISVGFGVLCLAANLHRAHAEAFVRWVKTYRLKPGREARGDNNSHDDNSKCDPAELHRVAEAYLFMQLSLQESSNAWGAALACCILVTGSLALLCLIGHLVTTNASLKSICILMAVTNIIICAVPVCILAYANGSTDLVSQAFQHSSFSYNYDLIGGRDKWMEYVTSNPTHWYIFGFAITQSWLFGFFSGVITAFGAVAVQHLTTI